jgi:hypothetical protein
MNKVRKWCRILSSGANALIKSKSLSAGNESGSWRYEANSSAIFVRFCPGGPVLTDNMRLATDSIGDELSNVSYILQREYLDNETNEFSAE